MKPFGDSWSARALAAAAVLLAGSASAIAADNASFSGRTITILVGSGTGGSTDLSARLIAPFLAKYLPGKPSAVVQNMPGAHNLIALNFFVQRAKRDGSMVSVASSSQTDPINYRVPQSRYDPTTFEVLGGIDLGGTSMIIRNEVLSHLTDKSKPPIAMGTVSGFPHVGMLMTAWGIKFLGWNAKWVAGYGNNSDLSLAMQRGELDMTSLADAWFLQNPALLDKSKFTIIYQTGSNGGTTPSHIPAISKVPLFTAAMKGKIGNGKVVQEAYDYWRDLSYVFKWAALPPKTPAPVVATFRAAFAKAAADPQFQEHGEKITPGFSVLNAEDLTKTIDELSKVSPEAIGYMTQLLHEQGLKVEAVKKHKKKKKKKKKE